MQTCILVCLLSWGMFGFDYYQAAQARKWPTVKEVITRSELTSSDLRESIFIQLQFAKVLKWMGYSTLGEGFMQLKI